jgi:hypothetical protein
MKSLVLSILGAVFALLTEGCQTAAIHGDNNRVVQNHIEYNEGEMPRSGVHYREGCPPRYVQQPGYIQSRPGRIIQPQGCRNGGGEQTIIVRQRGLVVYDGLVSRCPFPVPPQYGESNYGSGPEYGNRYGGYGNSYGGSSGPARGIFSGGGTAGGGYNYVNDPRYPGGAQAPN